MEQETHRARVVEERTVIDPKSLRYRCTCGAYGTPFLPDESADAWREGRAHEREHHGQRSAVS